MVAIGAVSDDEDDMELAELLAAASARPGTEAAASATPPGVASAETPPAADAALQRTRSSADGLAPGDAEAWAAVRILRGDAPSAVAAALAAASPLSSSPQDASPPRPRDADVDDVESGDENNAGGEATQPDAPAPAEASSPPSFETALSALARAGASLSAQNAALAAELAAERALRERAETSLAAERARLAQVSACKAKEIEAAHERALGAAAAALVAERSQREAAAAANAAAINAARAAANEEAALRRAALQRLEQVEAERAAGAAAWRGPGGGAGMAEAAAALGGDNTSNAALAALPAQQLQALWERLGAARDRVAAAVLASKVAEQVASRVAEQVDAAAQCGICMERPLELALSCGHRACTACAAKLDKCHVCRKPITGSMRVY
jgi:hypothetical protein